MPTSDELRMLQALPLDLKIRRTEQRIREWVDYWGKDHVCVSFSGGKDSTVLLHIVRKMYGDEIPAVFVNTGLEFPEIQRHVRSFPNVVILRPEMNFRDVIVKYGYPVISKEVSECIEATRNWCSKNLHVEENGTGVPIRVQQMFGVGKYSGGGGIFHTTSDRSSDLMSSEDHIESPMMSCNYWELARIAAENGDAVRCVEKMFGVRRAGPKLIKGNIPNKSRFSSAKYAPLLDADFLISNKCCAVMKKKPIHKWEHENNMHQILGTMAEESLLRTSAWLKNGCNVFNGQHGGVSTPMAFWNEQDVLHYIVDNNLKIPEVYGDIVPDEEHSQISMLHNYEGRLQCTGCSRTGCYSCAFGAGRDLLSTEGRYIRLARTHPKLYAYCMNGGAYDPEDGYWKPNKDGLGFAHVFDEINRLIPTKTGRPYIRYLPDGGEMERARKLDEEKKKAQS